MASANGPSNHSATRPVFWRDPRMPQVELRYIDDGREVGYAPHSHVQWSLGAITNGESTFFYRNEQHEVQAGDLVLMNPDWVHACNPVEHSPWAYFMMYVDTGWLTRLRFDAGLLPENQWQDLATAVIHERRWFDGYRRLAACLLTPERPLLQKQTALVEYLSALMHHLAAQPALCPAPVPARLQQVADHLNTHCLEDVSLDDLCRFSGYSASHLVRQFKQYFGITPHAYLVNRRIQHGQHQLKAGTSIAEVALNMGFADQAHFQRAFKRLVAATPSQYRSK
ncbi:AraC family transcriptional regulator [Oceanimonas sp. CHS3-5]|uniref:AraC family transcriptional regulator n=1 Tax=Oceanimonas sp. CHS3-5 TaxID=3068186 RepID=UPI00273F7EB4|nr:AraC family transcriptional regulator [Oceanimonas sp. CHS3-5]MDP5291267.1 AraC family transcriptional regulator [Oceanimonas sp. CHS3-5]